MPAAKNGNHIDITGDGNTLQSVYEDIADPSYFSSGGANNANSTYGASGCYCFHHHTNADCFFRVQNGGTLTIGRENDQHWHEEYHASTNRSTSFDLRFYVNAGGTLNVYGRSVINLKVGNVRGQYNYFYGRTNISGSATNKSNRPIIKNMYRNYWREGQNNDTFTNDIWFIKNCTFGPPEANGDYMFYFDLFSKWRDHTWENIQLSGSSGKFGYGLYTVYPIAGYENIIFKNIHFLNMYQYCAYSQCSTGWYKNCTFDDCDSWRVMSYRASQTWSPDRYDYGYSDPPKLSQNLGMYLEDCVFCDSGTTQNTLYATYGGSILLKGCDIRTTE